MATRVGDDARTVAVQWREFAQKTNDGLNIVEPVEAAEPAAERAKVVNVASWTDDSRSSLKPHEPAVTDIVVTLGSRH